MEKSEREQILKEAVLTMNPQRIREAGNKTGHPVKVVDDVEIVYLAAQMILFFIPDAPQKAKQEAMLILDIPHISFW